MDYMDQVDNLKSTVKRDNVVIMIRDVDGFIISSRLH